jgi:hypothetical protein
MNSQEKERGGPPKRTNQMLSHGKWNYVIA